MITDNTKGVWLLTVLPHFLDNPVIPILQAGRGSWAVDSFAKAFE